MVLSVFGLCLYALVHVAGPLVPFQPWVTSARSIQSGLYSLHHSSILPLLLNFIFYAFLFYFLPNHLFLKVRQAYYIFSCPEIFFFTFFFFLLIPHWFCFTSSNIFFIPSSYILYALMVKSQPSTACKFEDQDTFCLFCNAPYSTHHSIFL